VSDATASTPSDAPALWQRRANLGTLPSDPAEADEEIYQRARKINIAEFQIVTYKEYLPATLGEGSFGIMPKYTGYKDDVDPSAVTEFTTAAFRFGAWLMKRSISTRNVLHGCVCVFLLPKRIVLGH
jgi:hypothetical protein